jgi:anti-sigma B factor antagonist
MDFEASIDERDDAYSVVAVRGEVDLHTAPKLRYAIERGAEGVPAVVVDLSGVAFMDSTALSTLMRAKEAAEKAGSSLRLAAPSRGFRDYFDVYPSREAAVSA